MAAHLKGVRGLMKGALQLVYPPQCMGCGETVAQTGALCPACWREADFITGACCFTCGAPVPGHPEGEEMRRSAAPALRCDECLALQRPWLHGRAALTYRGTGRKLALMLKHGDRLDIAASLGDWVAAAAQPLVHEDMLVVPIPLHPMRLFKRRYNQAFLLARPVARAHGMRLLPHLLQRRRHTPPQDHGKIHQRYDNLQGAFAIHPRYHDLIQGRPILLVDDVMASGATMSVAATCLTDAGAGPISTAVLARAVKET